MLYNEIFIQMNRVEEHEKSERVIVLDEFIANQTRLQNPRHQASRGLPLVVL